MVAERAKKFSLLVTVMNVTVEGECSSGVSIDSVQLSCCAYLAAQMPTAPAATLPLASASPESPGAADSKMQSVVSSIIIGISLDNVLFVLSRVVTVLIKHERECIKSSRFLKPLCPPYAVRYHAHVVVNAVLCHRCRERIGD